MSFKSSKAFANACAGRGKYRFFGNEENSHTSTSNQENTKRADAQKAAENAVKNDEHKDADVKSATNKSNTKREKARKNRNAAYDSYCKSFSEKNDAFISLSFKSSPDKGYARQLIAGDFSNDYFNEKDGEIYGIVKAFYNSPYCTFESDCAIANLIHHFVQLKRYLLNESKSPATKKIQYSYATGESFNDGFMGKYKRNIIKEVAWGVTHSTVLDLIWTKKDIYQLIPKGEHLKTMDSWNTAIMSQNDISSEVKMMFIIDKIGGCKFRDDNKDLAFEKADVGPTEDTDDEDTVFNINLSNDKSSVAKDVEEMDKQFHATVANESTSNITFMQNTDNNTKYSDEMMNIIHDKISHMNDDPSSVVNPISAVTEIDEYEVNNKAFQEFIPRLSKFTEYVEEEGYKVLYTTSSKYPGMIDAIIKDDGNDVVCFSIDNCNVYGDTLRIVTNDSSDGDIHNETFIPINRKEDVISAIRGTLTTDKRKDIANSVPSVCNSDRYAYGFFDRVDMSGLSYNDSNGKKINGLQFDAWKKLVLNIASVVFDKDLPVSRFRIEKYENPGKFTLVADSKVKYPYNCNILYDENNINALKLGTRIVYDSSEPRGKTKKFFNVAIKTKN